jgi:transposase
MVSEQPEVTSVRVDDIPLLLKMIIRLGLPELYEREVGDHGHFTGLSGGWLLSIWLTFILTRGDHTKYAVEEWVERHRKVIEAVIEQPITASEFSDNRLGSVLKRLSVAERWERLESALWENSVVAYAVERLPEGSLFSAMVDSTTAYGYHEISAEGLMQRGHSKDHRDDLPQLKVMTLSIHPEGYLAASQVVSGERADDGLYLPIIARGRAMFGRTGVLYVGDAKMAALATRGDIASHQDYYLTVLPHTGEVGRDLPGWIRKVTDNQHKTEEITNAQGEHIGRGYEIESERHVALVGDKPGVSWTERVQVIQSDALAAQQQTRLEQRLERAEERLRALTPKPGRGKQAIRDQATLHERVATVMAEEQIEGLLAVTWQTEELRETHFIGRGRGGPDRPTREVVSCWYVITAVTHDAETIAQRKAELGWRVQATNVPAAIMSLNTCVQHYRTNWRGERNYHLLKSEPLGISPIFVHKDDQITGLTHVLTLGVRVQLLLEMQVQRALLAANTTIAGLHPGLPKQTTNHPTARALLDAIERMTIILSVVQLGQTRFVHITPLPPLLVQLLSFLGLPASLYTDLTQNE